jgi:hypothetical protein
MKITVTTKGQDVCKEIMMETINDYPFYELLEGGGLKKPHTNLKQSSVLVPIFSPKHKGISQEFHNYSRMMPRQTSMPLMQTLPNIPSLMIKSPTMHKFKQEPPIPVEIKTPKIKISKHFRTKFGINSPDSLESPTAVYTKMVGINSLADLSDPKVPITLGILKHSIAGFGDSKNLSPRMQTVAHIPLTTFDRISELEDKKKSDNFKIRQKKLQGFNKNARLKAYRNVEEFAFDQELEKNKLDMKYKKVLGKYHYNNKRYKAIVGGIKNKKDNSMKESVEKMEKFRQDFLDHVDEVPEDEFHTANSQNRKLLRIQSHHERKYKKVWSKFKELSCPKNRVQKFTTLRQRVEVSPPPQLEDDLRSETRNEYSIREKSIILSNQQY